MNIRALFLTAMLAPAAFCDLTVDQKVSDFMQLAALFAKNYAPYQWKRDLLGVDIYDVQPWLDQVKASKDDIDFYDVCVRYVARLQDSHDEYFLTSDFMVNLPVTLDLYDGKVLIDWINKNVLPPANYPLQVGDELVSLDGRSVPELIEEFLPYSVDASGSVTGRRRLAARTIWWRRQKFFPRAHQVGETATIVVRDQNGREASYVVPWLKSGTPITHAAPITAPTLSGAQQHGRAASATSIPDYLPSLRALQISGPIETTSGFAAYGQLPPSFTLPPDFQVRLGANATDLFVTATFNAGRHTVGYLRIPTLEPADQSGAFQTMAGEIAYFKANTDALVVDLMGNAGGDVCYTENVASLLFPRPFRGVISRLRATQDLVWTTSQELAWAKQTQSQAVIDLYTNYLTQVQAALNQDGGITGPLPVCPTDADAIIPPALARDGSVFAYTKPILTLVDDLTISSAELLAMFLQDEGRGTIFGVRTGGGGGSPGTVWLAGVFGEGNVRITRSIFTRKAPVSTPGYPTVDHFENVGIYPDIVVDYMTKENLMTGGKPYVDAFRKAVAGLIDKQP